MLSYDFCRFSFSSFQIIIAKTLVERPFFSMMDFKRSYYYVKNIFDLQIFDIETTVLTSSRFYITDR